MGAKDMAPGELLHKILYPRDPVVQVQKLQREQQKIKKYLNNAKSGDGNATDSRSGAPEKHEVGAATSGGTFSQDGIYRPQIVVTLPDYTSILRGFLRYDIAVHPPTGDSYVVEGPTYGEGDAPFTITLPLPLVPSAQAYYIRWRAVSSLTGPSEWSEPSKVLTQSDTTPPATPTGLILTSLEGGVGASWDAPPEKDYSYTEVWWGNNTVAQSLRGTAKGPFFFVSWDSSASPSTPHIWVRHVDNSGNISPFVHALATPGPYGDPSAFEWDIETAPLKFFNAVGNYIGTLLYSSVSNFMRLSSSNPSTNDALWLQGGQGGTALIKLYETSGTPHADIAGNTSLTGTLDVSGQTTLNDYLTVNSGAYMTGELDIINNPATPGDDGIIVSIVKAAAPSGGGSMQQRGISVSSRTDMPSGTMSRLDGVEAEATLSNYAGNTAIVSEAAAYKGRVLSLQTVSGQIDKGYGVYVRHPVSNRAGAITDYYGIYVEDPRVNGTPGNPDPVGGTAYAAYLEGDVHITGNLTVDGTSPGGGGGSDANYVHTQSSSSTTWTINHNLGKYPAIQLFSGANDDEFIADIAHVTTNQAVVTLSPAQSGKAFCN